MVELRSLEQQGGDHSPSRHDESSSSSSSESSEGQQVRKSRAEMDAAQILQQSPLFRNKSGRSSSSSPASPEQREPIARSSSPGSHSINARVSVNIIGSFVAGHTRARILSDEPECVLISIVAILFGFTRVIWPVTDRAEGNGS
ncbi:hypothetical protein Pmani_039196 [Petrolisthes manimaculis]|uniref:Uncharacterized protein n=1 Tax=Petrolisthes manimaculis TaxID=1843537 RepID=A0AAE1NEL9_9EUCA|nr:hypothetical protein Pmani_039196 [Petrolisthes manimaculis]